MFPSWWPWSEPGHAKTCRSPVARTCGVCGPPPLLLLIATSDRAGDLVGHVRRRGDLRAAARGERGRRGPTRRRRAATSRRRRAGRGCRRASALPEEGVVLPSSRVLSFLTTLVVRFRRAAARLKRENPLPCFFRLPQRSFPEQLWPRRWRRHP